METETLLMCKIGELENSFFDVTNRLTDSIWQIQLWCPWSKFQPYSILTRDTRVEFVIYCVLKTYSSHPCCWGVSTVHFNSIFIWSPFLIPFLSVDFVGENGHPSDNSNTDQKGQKGGEGLLSFCLLTTALLTGAFWSWGLVQATSGSLSVKRSKACI